jgi:GNAT superfamily N-acetyltransferase
VAVSCHHDIIDWLQPDWTLDMGSGGKFDWGSLRRRPELACTIARVDRAAWSRFARYHYLTAELASAAQCFGLWVGDQLAVFAGLMFRPHPVADNILGISRVVTLPDYQGLGLAFVLIDRIGAMLRALGWRLRNYPAHPAFVRAHDRSPNWALKQRPGQAAVNGRTRRLLQGRRDESNGSSSLGGRPCAVFEYVGPTWPDPREAMRITRYVDRHRGSAFPPQGSRPGIGQGAEKSAPGTRDSVES